MINRKWLPSYVAAFLAVMGLTAFAAAQSSTHFARSCSVTGASPQQLSAVLTACGYNGPTVLHELTLKNPDAAANTLYLGQSDVSAANGFGLDAGDAQTFRAASQQDTIDATRIYLFVASTQSAQLVARAK